MKYYVRKDASSEIEGPFELDAIRGWIARGRFTNDCEAIEERGRTIEEVQRSQRWDRLEVIFADPEPSHAGESPDSFLARVRQNSCYKTLRLFIDLSTIAAWGVSVFVIYMELSKRAQFDQLTRIVLAVVMIALLSIGLVAIRQSALLFADIADILIDQNRRR